jgi:replicative superfamily II helicase
MIRVKENSDKSIHGTYKSKEMTLKLLLENKKSLAESLKHKIEIFQETDDAVLNQSFTNYSIRLEKDSGDYTISLTKKLNIKKENMDSIEKMILDMAELVKDNTTLVDSSSSTNLLLDNPVNPNNN